MTHFENVVEHVMSNDDSELGKVKAERDYALHCLEREIAIAQSEQARLADTIGDIVTLRNLIASKIAQLRNYAANDCQIDHARTIAQGRIEQALQVQRWLDDLFPDLVGETR